jgi:predicted ATPase
VVDDLHWADPTTLELLNLVIDQGPTARMLTVLTFRPYFRLPWPIRSHINHLTLDHLPHQRTEEMVEQITGGAPLPTEVLEQIVQKTEGVPLFVEELTKMVLESGLLQAQGKGYVLTGPLPPLAFPRRCTTH